jgi:hypothetical protein
VDCGWRVDPRRRCGFWGTRVRCSGRDRELTAEQWAKMRAAGIVAAVKHFPSGLKAQTYVMPEPYAA